MVIKIFFIKDSISIIELEFHEAYTLGKQHKVYNKELLINTINEPGVSIHADLFSDRNILLGIGSY